MKKTKHELHGKKVWLLNPITLGVCHGKLFSIYRKNNNPVTSRVDFESTREHKRLRIALTGPGTFFKGSLPEYLSTLTGVVKPCENDLDTSIEYNIMFYTKKAANFCIEAILEKGLIPHLIEEAEKLQQLFMAKTDEISKYETQLKSLLKKNKKK